MPAPRGVNSHFSRLVRLLDLEARAEAEQARARLERLSPAEAERQGDCLTGLVVAEESSGLGGRCLGTGTLGEVFADVAALPGGDAGWTSAGVGDVVSDGAGTAVAGSRGAAGARAVSAADVTGGGSSCVSRRSFAAAT